MDCHVILEMIAYVMYHGGFYGTLVVLHPVHSLGICDIVNFACLQDGDCFFTRLLKIDVVSKTSLEWKEEGTFPGEPIFVPHPEASQEDQGVLLSVVLAGQSRIVWTRMCLAI